MLTYLASRLTGACSLPDQLHAALTCLEAVERATHVLAEHGPDQSARSYLSACAETGLAIHELLAVPSLSRPEETYLAQGGDPDRLVRDLTALADQIAGTLMSAANKTKATDRTACLTAAHHTCLLAKALR